MAHEQLGLGFSGLLFGLEQGQGVVFEGAVTVDAGQALCRVHATGAVGIAVRPCGVTGVAGLGAGSIGQVVGVETVNGGREVKQLRVSCGVQERVRMAALAEHGLARLGLGQQLGLVPSVMPGQHVGGRGHGDAHGPLVTPRSAVTVLAADLGGDGGHNLGTGQQFTAGGVTGLDGEDRVGVDGAVVHVGQNGMPSATKELVALTGFITPDMPSPLALTLSGSSLPTRDGAYFQNST